MKKYVKVILVASILLGLTGCGSNKEEIVNHCTLNSNNTTSGYQLTSEYDVYSVNGEVNKVVTKEVITSENQQILDYFESYLKQTYETQNETYGGTTNEVTNENGIVTSKTTIDYNKMDLETYVKDNTALKSYVNSNNKLKTNGIISIYESMGAVCE